MMAPSGTWRRAAIAAFFSFDDLITISPSYDVTMRCFSPLVTTTRRSPNSTTPATFDLRDVCSAMRAAVPLGERLDDVLAFLQRGDLVALDRAAILLADRDVLGDVDETARQIAGVCRLQSGVGETLSGTVGRDEVLEHGQSLTEVRLD